MRDEFIHQRLELWLSKRQELTALELALKLSDLRRAFQRPQPSPKAAFCIPDADEGFWYVPCDDSYVGTPLAMQQKAKNWWAFISHPSAAEALKQVEQLLDEEILERCHLMGMEADLKLARSLARCPFTKKVHVCAKNRLVEGRLPPYFDPRTPDAAQSRFRFVSVDITQSGEVDMKWCHLDWGCDFQALKDAFLANSSSFFVPRDNFPQIKTTLETLNAPHVVDEARELIGQLEQLLNNDPEPDVAFGWICNIDMSRKDRLYNFLAVDIYYSIKSIVWTPLLSRMDFLNMMETAQKVREQGSGRGGAHYPVFMQPWQVSYFCVLRRVRRLKALDLLWQSAMAPTST